MRDLHVDARVIHDRATRIRRATLFPAAFYNILARFATRTMQMSFALFATRANKKAEMPIEPSIAARGVFSHARDDEGKYPRKQVHVRYKLRHAFRFIMLRIVAH